MKKKRVTRRNVLSPHLDTATERMGMQDRIDERRKELHRLRNIECAKAMIVQGQIPWCRALILHVLAQAATSATRTAGVPSVLEEVLGELELDDDSDFGCGELFDRVTRGLKEAGWLE